MSSATVKQQLNANLAIVATILADGYLRDVKVELRLL